MPAPPNNTTMVFALFMALALFLAFTAYLARVAGVF